MQQAVKLSSAVIQSLRRSMTELWLMETQACSHRDNCLYTALFIQKLLSNLNRRGITSSHFCGWGAGQWLASTGPGAEKQQSQNSNPSALSSTLSPSSTKHSTPPVHQLILSSTYPILKMSQSSDLQEVTCSYYTGPNCRNFAILSGWEKSSLKNKSPNDSISTSSTPHLTRHLYFMQLKRKGWPTHRSRHFSPLEHHIFSYPSIGVHIYAFILVAHKHLHPVCFRQDDNGVRSNIALNLQLK